MVVEAGVLEISEAKLPQANELIALTKGWPEIAARLVRWAFRCAESTRYLEELDTEAFSPDGHPLNLRGWDDEVINLAHVSWAAGAAITALDQCAAALARKHGLHEAGKSEFSLRYFDSKAGKKKATARLNQLSSEAQTWVTSVLNDPQYGRVIAVRNPLTHGSTKRVVYAGSRRSEVVVPVESEQKEDEVPARELIETARELAYEYCLRFHQEVLLGVDASAADNEWLRADRANLAGSSRQRTRAWPSATLGLALAGRTR